MSLSFFVLQEFLKLGLTWLDSTQLTRKTIGKLDSTQLAV